MRITVYLFVSLLTAMLCFSSAKGQELPLVSGKYEKTEAEDFFKDLEKQTGFYFYYDTTQLDSLHIDVLIEKEPLDRALNRALQSTLLKFGIDVAEQKIYITTQIKLLTTLPTGFYDKKNVPVSAAEAIADYGFEGKDHKVTAENKIHEIGNKNAPMQATVLLNGTIRSSRTGEPFPNVSVLVDDKYSAISDTYGNYSLNIPPGKHLLNIVGFGIRETNLNLMVYSDGRMDIDMQEQIPTLKEVVVSSARTRNIRVAQMGVSRLSIDEIKKVPTVFGETDILRVITTLPGVKTVGEASTGFNVRGGSADQNLILFNENTIYNPSHFFGMFSAFNPEIVKDVELYKSSVPAKYGGRLSSVLDINSREGNKKKISGSAGIGLVTSRLQLEGPIAKDKTSFIFGGRTTYANWLIDLLPDNYDKSRASFQDLNLGVTHHIDSNDNIYLNGYYSRDQFKLNEDTTYGYTNRNFSLKWQHRFSRRLQGEIIGGYDYYKYDIKSGENYVNAFKLFFDIRQYFGKINFVYYHSQKHGFDFGLNTIVYRLQPGTFEPLNSSSFVKPDTVSTERALENALYFTHRFTPTNKLSFTTGLRYSLYSYMGPQSVAYYTEGQPVTDDTRQSIVNYGKGKIINNYHGPELRFTVRYAFTHDFSVKAGYNTQRQYIHLLSNTTAISPTDVWKLSDPNIRPQQGDQLSLGFYKNFRSNTIETSVEAYYKNIKDYLDYKPGATLLMNHNIETDVIRTKGKAYGIELLIKKPVGKLNGWLGYTYSRILLRSAEAGLGNIINDGDFYPANYDKPHDFVLAGNFRVNHRFSLSLNSTYSTGRPITYPIGKFYYEGAERVLYSDRNQYRIPDYYRTDFAINIEGNHKVHQKTHNSWTLGVYNMLGRRNPYSVYFVTESGRVNGYQLSIFGSAIPFINYNIRF
ncbi:TonB-dependent receptor [Niabella aquatica]